MRVHRDHRHSWRPAAGQAGVHTEGTTESQAASARDSRDHGPVPSGAGPPTHWNRSGRPGSSPDPMGFDRAVAARTRSRPFSTRCAARPPNGCGCWTRTWPRRSTESITTSYSPRLGSFPARGLIRGWLKAGVFEKGKGFAPTEEGTPQGGVISALATERRTARAGGGRRGPLPDPPARDAGSDQPGQPGGDQIRRRPGRAVSHPRAGRTGQGAAGRMAAAPGLGLQRGQDPHRAPRPRGSTSWGSTSAATPTASC